MKNNSAGLVEIYWSDLTLRPRCVDRLEITIGEQQFVFLDPADDQVRLTGRSKHGAILRSHTNNLLSCTLALSIVLVGDGRHYQDKVLR